MVRLHLLRCKTVAVETWGHMVSEGDSIGSAGFAGHTRWAREERMMRSATRYPLLYLQAQDVGFVRQQLP